MGLLSGVLMCHLKVEADDVHLATAFGLCAEVDKHPPRN